MGLAPERGSIDEAYLDLTLLVAKEESAFGWRSEDVVVVGKDELDLDDEEELFLAKGVVVANRIRKTIRDRLRLETCAGVSLNKSFSKYASALHKPSRTTCIPPAAHGQLLKELKPEKINGIGPALMESIREICSQRVDFFVPDTLFSLQRLGRHELDVLGASGLWVYDLCRGVDNREVKDKGPPGSFGFLGAHYERLSSMQQLYGVILTKAAKLNGRLEEDEALYQRTCRTLGVSFRFEGKAVSRTLAMPASGPNRTLEICDAAMSCINKHYKKDARVLDSPRFGLTASGFSNEGSGMVERSISAFLKPTEVKWEKQEEKDENLLVKFLKEKRPRQEEEVVGEEKQNIASATTTCPICSEDISCLAIEKHVNGHFKDDEEKQLVKKTTKGALDAFVVRRKKSK